MHALIVEDDESVARFLERALTEEDHTPKVVGDGLTALTTARTEKFDIILLDLMLPRMNGFEVCRRLRSSGIETPILILTARDSLEDIVEGLDSGADNYVVKPFQLAELLARTRALLRRGESSAADLTLADLTLRPAHRQATRGGKVIKLSATECTLLEYLMRNAGTVVSRCVLLQHVWPDELEGNENVLEVYISYLRGKIDKGHDVQLIHTVRGVGYRMAADVA